MVGSAEAESFELNCLCVSASLRLCARSARPLTERRWIWPPARGREGCAGHRTRRGGTAARHADQLTWVDLSTRTFAPAFVAARRSASRSPVGGGKGDEDRSNMT